jgi:ADP-ribosylglycohydrolase
MEEAMSSSSDATPTAESRVSGCLLGGAIGDAMGAPIEFLSLSEIQDKFGPQGLTSYEPAYRMLGAITDDTQMALWTAEGLIRADNRFADRGICNVADVVHRAYLRWLNTQGVSWDESSSEWPGPSGWLIRQGFLHQRRAPGLTCLSALKSGECGGTDRPWNDTKGCGGIMRVAPVGLVSRDAFRLGAELAAITHGHPTGYLAAGTFALIISEICKGLSLEQSISSALDELKSQENHHETLDAVQRALSLVGSEKPLP